MRTLLVLVVLLFSVGCETDAERSREHDDPIVQRQSVSCTYPGYCYDCGLDFKGKFSCGFGYSNSCSGRQQADVQITTWYIGYASGRNESFQETTVLKRIGPCR